MRFERSYKYVDSLSGINQIQSSSLQGQYILFTPGRQNLMEDINFGPDNGSYEPMSHIPPLYEPFEFHRDPSHLLNPKSRHELFHFLFDCRLWFPMTKATHARCKVVVERRTDGTYCYALLVGPLYVPVLASNGQDDYEFGCLLMQDMFQDFLEMYAQYLHGFVNRFPNFKVHFRLYGQPYLNLTPAFLRKLARKTALDRSEPPTEYKLWFPKLQWDSPKHATEWVIFQIGQAQSCADLFRRLGKVQDLLRENYQHYYDSDVERMEKRRSTSLEYHSLLQDRDKLEVKVRKVFNSSTTQDKKAANLLSFLDNEINIVDPSQPKISSMFFPVKKQTQ